MIKYTFNSFTPFDPKYITEKLERQARRGWFPEKMGKTLIRYRKDQPKNTRYALAVPFDGTRSEEWQNAGWHSIESKTDYIIYQTESPDALCPASPETADRLDDFCQGKRSQQIWSLCISLFALGVNSLNIYARAHTFDPPIAAQAMLLTLTLALLYAVPQLFFYLYWMRRKKQTGRMLPDSFARLGVHDWYLPLLLILMVVSLLLLFV